MGICGRDYSDMEEGNRQKKMCIKEGKNDIEVIEGHTRTWSFCRNRNRGSRDAVYRKYAECKTTFTVLNTKL